MAVRGPVSHDSWRRATVRARWWNVALVAFELGGAGFLHSQGWSWPLIAAVFAAGVAALVVAIVVMLMVLPDRLHRRRQAELALFAQRSAARAAENAARPTPAEAAGARVVQLPARTQPAPALSASHCWDTPKDAA